MSFAEAVGGVKKELLVERKLRCKTCDGSRSAPGCFPARCWTCYGKGVRVYKNGPFLEQEECFTCHGVGSEVRFPCPECRGAGVFPQKVLETLSFAPLSDQLESVVFEKKGHESPNGLRGRLVAKLEIVERGRLVREGLNVLSDEEIPVWKALLGGAVLVKTLRGEENVELSIALHSQVIELKGLGAQCPRTGRFGDHLARVLIRSPRAVSPEHVAIFRKLLELDLAEEECERSG